MSDKWEELLSVLGIKSRETLARLAAKACRSSIDQLRWYIQADASGQLKDLGDDRINPKVVENEIPLVLEPGEIRLDVGPGPHGSGDAGSPPPPQSKGQ